LLSHIVGMGNPRMFRNIPSLYDLVLEKAAIGNLKLSLECTLLRPSRRERTMKKSLFHLAAAALVAAAALSGSAIAQDRSRNAEPAANQLADRSDARTARMRADLRLTPEQENNWAGFENAMRDNSKRRADREIALRADHAQQKGPVDFIDQMRKGADSMSAVR
jgi:hypothetical protein